MADIGDDLGFQRAEWRAQRVGRALMLGLVAAGALGAAGEGPLAHASAGDRSGPLALEYSRFARSGHPTAFDLYLGPGPGDEVTLWIADSYLREVRLLSLVPAPRVQRLAGDRRLFTFDRAGGAGGQVRVHVEPDRAGALRGELGMVGGPALGFRQLVFP